MNFAAIAGVLNDLPGPFKRPGAPYTQLIDAGTGALLPFAAGADGMVAQGQSLSNAQDGWLDVWGLIAGVPRNPAEANAPYRARIAETLLAWVGTPAAVQTWLNLFAPGGTMTENDPGPGYTITLPSGMPAAQISAFVVTLARIRPAGVPFVVNGTVNGLFLGTVNFLGEGRVQGAYLSNGGGALPLGLSAMTNSAAPLLPTLYLSDPSLNA